MSDISRSIPATADERMTLRAAPYRVEARAGSTVIASSRDAILLEERGHAPVFYFPPSDVDLAALEPLAGRRTHCPLKGDAHYWAIKATPGRPVAWSYAQPLHAAAAIAGHIAFYEEDIVIVADGAEGDAAV